MEEMYERTQMLFGSENIEKIKGSHIAVFGVGGVGSFACEALARAGIGKFDLIDNDVVAPSNLNRQLIALTSTVGQYKVEVMKNRILDINPESEVNTYKTFYLPETADEFDFTRYDYIIDAIDTVAGKVEIIVNADKAKTPVISSMGAGNKVNPDMFEVADIYKTSVCPLAKVMRTRLKKLGIKKLKVVYSKEKPIKNDTGVRYPGSNSFTPSVAGLIIAGEVIKDITGFRNKG